MIMGKYVIDNDHFALVGEVYLQSGMMLKMGTIEGPCEFVFGKLYIYPENSDEAMLVNIGDEVEVLSDQLNIQELERRKEAIVNRQLDWQDRRSFDPSNESW